MREVIYIQAGNFANFTGTHFWNTQEAYFTYDDETEPLVSHDLSFREGITSNSEPVLNPRVLIFDHKRNFGTLSRSVGRAETNQTQPSWTGPVEEIAEEPIPQSSYHTSLEEEEANEKSKTEDGMGLSSVRYWSDYSRVYYAPKSIHPLSDPLLPDADDDWNAGRAMFNSYDEDAELMEGAVRNFVEECDSLQGIQVINDVNPFGSFIDRFLAVFQEDFDAKVPSLVFPILSQFEAREFDPYNTSAVKKTLNNALCLRGLLERASLTVPIRSPTIWAPQMKVPGWNTSDIFHSSALLSAHLETCTLPIRLKKNPTSMRALVDHAGGVSHFATLDGLFPVTNLSHSPTRFSSFLPRGPYTPSASVDVSRGLSPAQITNYEDFHLRRGLNEVFVLRTHTDAYPLPSSFPALDPRVQSVPVFTTLVSTPTLAPNISAYAKYVDGCIKWKRGLDVLDGGVDDMRELKEDLLNLVEKLNDGWDEEEEDS